MRYLKLDSNQEYKIGDNHRELLYKHDPSGQTFWTISTIAHLDIEDLRIASWNPNLIECQLSDGRWYRQDGMNNLVLTYDEVKKDEQKKSEDNPEKKSIFSLWGKSNKDEKNRSKGYVSNDDYDETDTWLKRCEEEEEREEEEFEEKLGDNFKDKDPLEQLTILFGLYKSGQSTVLVQNWLEEVLDQDDSKIEDFFNTFKDQYRNKKSDVNPEEWAKKTLEALPFLYKYKYPELEAVVMEMTEDDESDIQKPKNIFDFSANRNNKKIKEIKAEIQTLTRDLNYEKGRLKTWLVSLEKNVRRYVDCNEEIKRAGRFLKNKSTGFFSLLENKEERAKIKEAEENIKRQKRYIDGIEKSIVHDNKNIKEFFEELQKIEKKLTKKYLELFKLTNNKNYKKYTEVSGDSVNIAKLIAKNPKKSDLKYYLSLFEIK